MNDAVRNLSKDELVELAEIYAKNLVALDGTWFQSVEAARGMDEAMRRDEEAWRRFSLSEARRIKKFLDLDERPGLEGLARALPLRCQSAANVDEVRLEDGALVYRIVDCRVQNARERKGMGFHPCKSVGIEEYGAFARGIDERIVCECLSCFPDVEDDTCNCAWRFTMEG
ncbi:DUF6125 family protein [Arabiibacter massiliensis]|uniref:DUF6125 family protein n=1 Tax=Arabiibacter massiliensis TaxID=1870985 RepID=UPI0009B932BE|nr:DUF6125 family protein [Arabiibacter massiliensis]